MLARIISSRAALMAGMRQYGQNLARGTISGSRGLLGAPARARASAGGNCLRACGGITETAAHALPPKWPKHNDAAFLAYGLAAERGGFQCG
jgi:hypothetical protein